MGEPVYPWYRAVRGEDIEQGDILEGCPVFLPTDDLAETTPAEAVFRWEEFDLIVMSQTCDMVKGREKLSDVLLCPAWRRSELVSGHLATPKGLEDVRRGNLPGFHLVADCSLPGFERGVSGSSTSAASIPSPWASSGGVRRRRAID